MARQFLLPPFFAVANMIAAGMRELADDSVKDSKAECSPLTAPPAVVFNVRRRAFRAARASKRSLPRRANPVCNRSLLRLLHRRDQFRHYLEQIAHDAIIGNLEYRSVGVFIDGHHGARYLHAHQVLDGARNADCEV